MAPSQTISPLGLQQNSLKPRLLGNLCGVLHTVVTFLWWCERPLLPLPPIPELSSGSPEALEMQVLDREDKDGTACSHRETRLGCSRHLSRK